MQWLTDNWESIFSVIGAIYTIALVIVKLTPNKRDDQGLEKAYAVIAVIAKVLGLNPIQGIGAPPLAKSSARPMAAALVAVAFALVLCSGCATVTALQDNDRAELVASQKAFAAAVDGLAELREQGVFTKGVADEITLVIAEGRKYLSDWADAVKAGESRPTAWEEFNKILARLIALKGGS